MSRRLKWLSLYIVVLGVLARPARAQTAPPCCPFYNMEMQCMSAQEPCLTGFEREWYTLSWESNGVGWYNHSYYEDGCAWVGVDHDVFSMECVA